MNLNLGVMTPGKWMGKLIPIRISPFVIGRSPQCHLQPASAKISQRHCALLTDGDKVIVRDFKSAIGTLVNGKPVLGEAELQDRDCLKVGPMEFRVHIDRAPSGDAADDAAAELLLAGESSRRDPGDAPTSFIEEDAEVPTEAAPVETEAAVPSENHALSPPRKSLPAPPPHVKLAEAGETLVVTITNPELLEAKPIRTLRMYLLLLAEGRAYQKIVISLEAVESMDSMFLASLIDLDKKVKDAGGKLAICQLRPENWEVFANLDLGKTLNLYKKEGEAIQALRHDGGKD